MATNSSFWDNARDFVKGFENPLYKGGVYVDPVGIPTAGYNYADTTPSIRLEEDDFDAVVNYH